MKYCNLRWTGPLLIALTVGLAACDQSSDSESMSEKTPEHTQVPAVDMASEPEAAQAETQADSPSMQTDVEAPVPEPEVQAEASETTSQSESGSGELYDVADGNKLDAFSYEGFKLYRNWCARCHGTYGQGMVGPNLAESLNVISKAQFIETVAYGKTGQIGSMPAWESNASVMDGMDNLYAYLKARADGAIGEVKPSKQ